MANEIELIIQKAEETLKTAKYGFDDLVGVNRQRRFSGLRNLIVFGRSVTFVIQNLKTPVGEERFNKWYHPHQEAMKSDIVMKYFVTLRNEILKEGSLPISTSVSVNFSSSDIEKLGTPPPGATGFFMGDKTGGSGWIIDFPDGKQEHYYVEIPESIAKVQQHFSELPAPENSELKSKPIEELCTFYLEKLESIVDSATKEFLNKEVHKAGKIRLPSYLRVVK